jgi:hypothetical protein
MAMSVLFFIIYVILLVSGLVLRLCGAPKVLLYPNLVLLAAMTVIKIVADWIEDQRRNR